MSTSLLQNPEIDYSVKQNPVAPQYEYAKKFADVGPAINIANGAESDVIFEIPAVCFNPARSSVNFTSTPEASGNGFFNWMFKDCIAAVSEITLYNAAQVKVCDMRFVDKMSSVMLKAETRTDEAVLVDKGEAGMTSDTYGAVCGTVAGEGNERYDSTPMITNPFEPQYLGVGEDNTATPVQNIEMNLSLFKNSILAMDKDFYFGEVMYLRIKFNRASSWGFYSSADDDPAATAAVALPGAIGLSKLNLQLAVEINPVICGTLKEKVMSAGGFTTVIPHVHSIKNTIAHAEEQAVTLKLGRMQGRHLKRIYHVPFDAAEAIETRYLHTNLDRANFISYRTEINGNRRQRYDQVTENNDDWYNVKQYLNGTLVGRMETFRYNWFILDNFTPDTDASADTGLPLDVELKWDVILRTADVGFQHYTFAVVTRMLNISSGGIIVQ